MGQKKENQQEKEFLTELGRSYAAQQKEQLEQYSDKKTPKELNDWFQDFCNNAFSEEAVTETTVTALPEFKEKKRAHTNTVHMLKRVVAIVLIVFGIGGLGATISVKAFNFDLWKIFTKMGKENAEVANTDKLDEIGYYLSSDWYGFYCPAYVPEGYELVSETMDNRCGSLIFQNGEKKLVFYTAYGSAIVSLDKENAECEEIKIDDKELYYVISTANGAATGYIDKYMLKLCFEEISEPEIKKIFKNLKKYLN